ncbi:RNA polymerase sigma-70 factor (ECF subfamily) [Stackebrandtia albiflava]|uniref:RNA polymerase sigma-70 factor (ECF subfamily) n=1 Tax=Stackebrandtia albiflava TaxID=406432 RepID=A0A562VB06_9ACTN|nr:RNA polymerase sigma factor SigJ [Stackebrandtia albiflava]TWJ15043.1 RNA polymerase sigma-70 factor (ECF subfamily) [Stackebrandtia albiflava]
MTEGDARSVPGRDADPDTVMGERRHLMNLAYRLLGSLAEAEDAVQETFTRWYAMPSHRRDGIRSPGAWLTTVAGRICLDQLGSARVRRERYVGEWIPEPLPDAAGLGATGERIGDAADPADRVTLDESVTMAFLVTLESMTPAERVSLILHDVYGYTFPEVAGIVGRTPAACRQLASSARRRARARERPPTPPARQSETVRAFRRAWRSQDLDALLGVLDPDAEAVADGGGVTPAAASPIRGAEAVARHYAAIAAAMPAGVEVRECPVNGGPGLAMRFRGVTVTVFAFDVVGDRIRHIWAVRNPDKLRRWPVAPEDPPTV